MSLAWSAAATTLALELVVVVLIVSLVLLALLRRLIRALVKCIVTFLVLGTVVFAAGLLHAVAFTSAVSARSCLAVCWMIFAAAVHGGNNASNAHLRERIIACNLQSEDPFYSLLLTFFPCLHYFYNCE